jgi:hypothetical protein
MGKQAVSLGSRLKCRQLQPGRGARLLRKRLAGQQERMHHSDEDLRILAVFLGCEQDFTKGV